MASWALHDAKARLSEVIDRALREGPQQVTRHGKPAVVVVASDDWQRLQAARPKPSLAAFLLAMPQGGPDDMFDPLPPAQPREIDF